MWKTFCSFNRNPQEKLCTGIFEFYTGKSRKSTDVIAVIKNPRHSNELLFTASFRGGTAAEESHNRSTLPQSGGFLATLGMTGKIKITVSFRGGTAAEESHNRSTLPQNVRFLATLGMTGKIKINRVIQRRGIAPTKNPIICGINPLFHSKDRSIGDSFDKQWHFSLLVTSLLSVFLWQ